MGLLKGCYVRCTQQNRAGVVSEVKVSGYAYVRWMSEWDDKNKVVTHYLEYVNLNDIQQLPEEGIHPGLYALRRITLG